MKRVSRNVVALAAVLLLVLTTACVPTQDDITTIPSAEQGTIEIRVTDPPDPEFSSIEVSIDPEKGIEVHKVVSGESGEWIPVPLAVSSFDLKTLVGVTETLGAVETAAGSFTQIRVYIDTVMVTPEGGTPEPATVPSGILRIVRPFNVQEGRVTTLTLDFDGGKSIVTTGQGEFIFKPVVHLLVEHSSPPATGEDTTPPVIDLTGVTEGQVIITPNTVTPEFSASDDSGFDPDVAATLEVDGLVEPSFSSGTEISEVGTYTLVVTAEDDSHNVAEVATNFEIIEDTTPPVIGLTGVTEGQVIITPNTVTPEFSASDDSGSEPTVTATLKVDDLVEQPFASGTEISEVGTYILVVTATDTSDNVAEVTINFTIAQE